MTDTPHDIHTDTHTHSSGEGSAVSAQDDGGAGTPDVLLLGQLWFPGGLPEGRGGGGGRGWKKV